MFRNIFNFVVCTALAVLLCIYVSGLGGLFIAILLVLALGFSALLLAVTRKTVSVSMQLSANVAGKGEEVDLDISIAKSTILPTSFVELTIELTPNITTEHMRRFKVISARRDGDLITVSLKTELCGEATVRLSEVRLMDYLGIISCKLPSLDLKAVSAAIKIMPEIRDAGVQSEVLKSTSENAAANEEEDEESNEAAIGLTGVAGYEHRKYEMGDPLKRVNWKLSSKKDELMVRLDDKILTATQDFILDYPVLQNADRTYYVNADRIVEASLSMLSMLLMQGFQSSYSYYLDGWQTVEVEDEKSLLFLQEELAGIRPMPLEQRYDRIGTADNTAICFTTCMGNMWQEIAVFNDTKGCSLVVTEQSGIGKICANMWKVNNDFEFIPM